MQTVYIINKGYTVLGCLSLQKNKYKIVNIAFFEVFSFLSLVSHDHKFCFFAKGPCT